VAFAWDKQAAYDQADAGNVAERNAHEWRDEIALEGVLDKESDSQKQEEPAQPRKELHTEEVFETDRAVGTMLLRSMRTQNRGNGNRGRSGWGHKDRLKRGYGFEFGQNRRDRRRSCRANRNGFCERPGDARGLLFSALGRLVFRPRQPRHILFQFQHVEARLEPFKPVARVVAADDQPQDRRRQHQDDESSHRVISSTPEP
jgi:hypothetical protein